MRKRRVELVANIHKSRHHSYKSRFPAALLCGQITWYGRLPARGAVSDRPRSAAWLCLSRPKLLRLRLLCWRTLSTPAPEQLRCKILNML